MAGRQHRLILMPSGRQGDVPDGMTVLEAAYELGVEIESICGGQGICGKCLVRLEQGQFPKHGITSASHHLTPPEAEEFECADFCGVDLDEYRVACLARIVGDVLIHVPESSQAQKQKIYKAAGDRQINLNPALRLMYVEVPSATLGGPDDWERLRAALKARWDLDDVRLDPLLLRQLQAALRQQQGAVTLTVWQGREIIAIAPGLVEHMYGLAVDVGSTTLAGHLCDLQTGEILATATMMNPQVRFGEDLVSRISYAMSDGADKLHNAIIEALNDLSRQAAAMAGIEAGAIAELVMVGNTVMHHLLLGIDPGELGHLPFALATAEAVDLKARDLGLNAVHVGAMVHVLPCIAGYVGADNVGVLLAESQQFDDQVTLVVDIGTNAEILLGTKDRILSASSPTGPAFEGAQITHGQRAAAGAIERIRIDADGYVRYKVVGDERWSNELLPDQSLHPTGICGSGIIEAVAELLAAGLIGGNGRFVKGDERIRRNGKRTEFVVALSDAGRDIVITQTDIRAVQLAKGALLGGVRLLMDHLGVEQVDRIRLAGAFGSHIDPVYATRIGLIPPCEDVAAIGNAAGDGALIALLNQDERRRAAELVRQIEYVETAAEMRFQDYFVEALALL